MPLTPEQRKAHVTFITANCECWKGPKDAETLNTFDDDKLVKLKAGIDKSKAAELATNALSAIAKEFELPTNLVINDMPEALKKKAKKVITDPAHPDYQPPADKKPPVGNAEPPKVLTLTEWEATLPPPARDVWNSAKAINMRELTNVRNQLIKIGETETDPQRKEMIQNKLNANLPLESLTELLILVKPKVDQTNNNGNPFPPIYFGDPNRITNTGPSISEADREAGATMVPPTLNSDGYDPRQVTLGHLKQQKQPA